MIFGHGIDICLVDRFSEFHPQSPFLKRFFQESEISYAFEKASPKEHLAGFFAAREALLKALGTGMSEGIRLQDMEVIHLPSGQPFLKITGRTQELLKSKEIKAVHLSISHHEHEAVASVILET